MIEAGSAPGLANLARLPVAATTTFVVPAVPAGTYHVRVRASAGGVPGAASPEVIVTSSGAAGGPCTPVEIPGHVSFTLTGRQVSFTWEGPARGAQPAGYTLEAGLAPGLSNAAVVAVGPGRSFGAAAPPGTYYIRLRAANACGATPPGPEIRLDVP